MRPDYFGRFAELTVCNCVSPAAAASVLGVSIGHLETLRLSGRIESTTDPETGRLVYSFDAVIAYLHSIARDRPLE